MLFIRIVNMPSLFYKFDIFVNDNEKYEITITNLN